MKKDQYKNYFKKHYKYTLSDKDIRDYQQWFYTQWKLISKKIFLDNNSKILEIGSGVGGFFKVLLEVHASQNYEGIELDSVAVRFSNKHFKSNKFENISLEEYKTKKKFNYIFAFEILEHLDNPKIAVEKMYQLLEKNGIFVGTTPYPFYKNIIADETHMFVLHPKNWERIFSQAGFSNIELYPMSFLPFLWRINKRLNFRLPFYFFPDGIISTCLIIAKK